MKSTILFILSLSLSGPAMADALAPNEMGKIMILEYHQIGPKEGEWRRTPENFKQDLKDLYDQGYRLVNLNQVLDGEIDLPAGTTPVVMTFDDGSSGHFRKKDGKWDPESAVGMILDFNKNHPEMGVGGTFYINALSSKSLTNPDGSSVLADLVKDGFEIGNHTWSHPKLKKLSQKEVAMEYGKLQDFVQKHVPGYKIRTTALPFGIYPKEVSWAAQGEWTSPSGKRVSYSHDGLLEVGAGPAPSPFSESFDPMHIPRIQARTSELQKFYSYFQKNPDLRYVSDGNPAVVAKPK